jgi:CHAP domain
VGVVVVVAAVVTRSHGTSTTPLRARIVSIAQSQLGYTTDPPDTYCNKYSAYWYAGTDDCGNDNRDEEWCADFAAWVWKQAGALVDYQLAPGYLNGDTASFYLWGVDHGTWHPVGSGYTPQPGDVAVYGLNTSAVTAVHVAIVTASTGNDDAPDVVNGDGDRTGFSVVEAGQNQSDADVKGDGAPLSGYVSPSSPPSATPS